MSRRKSKKNDDDGTAEFDLQLEELTLRERELQNLPAKLTRQKREQEMTLPPCPEIEERERAKRHEDRIVTRGEAENVVREHDRSLLMLFLLMTCTASLVWWAFRLME